MLSIRRRDGSARAREVMLIIRRRDGSTRAREVRIFCMNEDKIPLEVPEVREKLGKKFFTYEYNI